MRFAMARASEVGQPALATSQQETGAAARSDACAAMPARASSSSSSSSFGAGVPRPEASSANHSRALVVMAATLALARPLRLGHGDEAGPLRCAAVVSSRSPSPRPWSTGRARSSR